MTRVATSWLVYRLTKSSLLLGTVGFAGQIPTFLLAPLAGVIVDRIDRRKVLVWTQALAMVQSLLLAWLTLSHRINITEILVLSSMQGVINAFDMPGRQSFMIRMVENRADLVQRDCHQFLDGECGATDRTIARRLAHRRHQ